MRRLVYLIALGAAALAAQGCSDVGDDSAVPGDAAVGDDAPAAAFGTWSHLR